MNSQRSYSDRWHGRITHLVLAVALTALVAWALFERLDVLHREFLAVTFRGVSYELQHPEAFLLLFLAPVFVAIQAFAVSPWSRIQQAVQILLRTALIAALSVALSLPTTTETEVELCVAYVVDTTASVTDAWLESASAWVTENSGGSDEHSVVFASFGEEVAQVDPLADGSLSFVREDNATTTDIGAALQAGASMCPAGAARRVVLLTDGEENVGDAAGIASSLRAAGVETFTIALDVPVTPEVFIDSVEFPDEIDVSEPFTIQLRVFSSTEASASLTVMQNDVREPTLELDLEPGINHVSTASEVPVPGIRRYSFNLRAEGPDRFEENNSWTEQFRVEGRPQVLYVEGQSRSRHYLQRAVSRDRNDLANFDLEVRGAYSMPSRLEEMENYDAIIISDVSAEYISQRAMRNLERYVRELGGGLILVGGEDSFGPGGFEGTPLEDISPVHFDMERGREEPSLAMLLVLDRSGSMQGVKIEMAKDAASAVVDLLGPQDFVGVISFDSVPQTNVPLQQVSARTRIRNEIGRIAPGGGTDIYPALEEAYFQLLAQPARMHHIILLTDGQAPWDGISDLASSMRSDRISISTVGVGAEADGSLLQMIAEIGSGRFYATSNPGNIPRIFVQEAARVSRTAFSESPMRAIPVQRAASLRGIDWSSAPYLLGYVKTRPKNGAQVLLRSDSGDPILARWRLGLGQVAAFTSDIKNRWAVEWVRTSIYPRFWAQVIRDSMRVKEDSPWEASVLLEDERARIRVDALREDGTFMNGAELTATVVNPEGESEEIPLPQRAPGRYEAHFDPNGFGTFTVMTSVTFEGSDENAPETTFTRPFPSEYEATGVDERALQRIAQAGGGALNPQHEAIWSSEGAERDIQVTHWKWPALLALCLLLVDVLFRRIRILPAPARTWDAVTKRS